jgi:glycosyltransferase involved in cell wall biosynthesis
MKILFVDLESEWRGGQNQALLALRGFRAEGHEAELVAIENGALAKRARGEGIFVHAVAPRAKRLAATRIIRRLLARKDFEIVHANEPHALTAAWLAGAHRRAALVTSRRIALPLKKGRIAEARYRAARRIIAVSQFVAESVRASGLPASQVEVIHDGVEIPAPTSKRERDAARRLWNVRDGETLLGCVSYLLPEKGQRELLEAFSVLRKEFPALRVLLAGDGPCRAELKQLAAKQKFGDGVIFAGRMEDIATVYQALDAFIFPSLEEPLGSSLLAAMAYGLPVVARESGGVPEIIQSARNGLLVSESNAGKIGNALAASIAELLSEPIVSREMGAAARKTIEERFSATRMARETLRVYEAVLTELAKERSRGSAGA